MVNLNGFVPIIKCVGFGCNLRCKYCFYHQESQVTNVMPPQILEVLIREIYRANCHNGPVTFIWHGGEPMVAGRKFYYSVLELQEKYNERRQVTVNGIQTNGTLIDDEWARFFKEYDFQVGVSLDGPPEFHDSYRYYPNGRGSFEDVMRGITVLREHGLQFGIVSVITDVSVNHPEKVFRFFLENGLYKLKFSRAIGEDRFGNRPQFAPSPEEYGRFLLRVLDLWLEEDDPRLEISPIVEIFSSLVQGESCAECLFSAMCDRFWIVNPNGDIYTCPSEGVISDGKVGNITDGFEAIQHSLSFQRFRREVSEFRKLCRKCRWYKVCKGGCLVDYQRTDGERERNALCGSFQHLFKKAQGELVKYELIKTEVR